MVDAVKRRDALCAPNAAVDYSYHVAVKDVSGDLINSIEDAVNSVFRRLRCLWFTISV